MKASVGWHVRVSGHGGKGTVERGEGGMSLSTELCCCQRSALELHGSAALLCADAMPLGRLSPSQLGERLWWCRWCEWWAVHSALAAVVLRYRVLSLVCRQRRWVWLPRVGAVWCRQCAVLIGCVVVAEVIRGSLGRSSEERLDECTGGSMCCPLLLRLAVLAGCHSPNNNTVGCAAGLRRVCQRVGEWGGAWHGGIASQCVVTRIMYGTVERLSVCW